MSVKLILIDVDGVMTNGTKTYDKHHEIISKQFNDRDFTAIKRFKAAGIQVAFLSADIWNFGMAASRNVEYWDVRKHAPDLDKSKMLPMLCEAYQVEPEQICFIGDDIWDASLMVDVGYKYCPGDACYTVQEICAAFKYQNGNGVLNRLGGGGCIDALYYILRNEFQEKFPSDDI